MISTHQILECAGRRKQNMFVHEIWHLLSVCCGHKMINHSAANWICT